MVKKEKKVKKEHVNINLVSKYNIFTKKYYLILLYIMGKRSCKRGGNSAAAYNYGLYGDGNTQYARVFDGGPKTFGNEIISSPPATVQALVSPSSAATSAAQAGGRRTRKHRKYRKKARTHKARKSHKKRKGRKSHKKR